MKILIFEIKSICYNSTFYFAGQFKEALEKCGCQVDIFNSSVTPLTQLEQYEGSHYDAVIDFNSILPSIQTNKDDYFLNTIDAPFFNYILDHPVYHHDMLKQKINNYNVICLDEFHRAYIERNYPNIKKVVMMPLGTSLPDSDIIPVNKRKYDILFTGTYTDPSKASALIQDMGPLLSEEMLELADIMKNDPSLTIEAAAQILINNGLIYINYAEHMKVYFLVDTYIKAFFRMKLLKVIADSGLNMTIIGSGWEKSGLDKYSNVTCLPPVDFNSTFNEMGNAKVVLNSMPWFKGGLHDRILSAMSCHAIAFSENSTYIEKNFTNKKDIMTFSSEEISQCPGKLFSLFEEPVLMENISENGFLNVSHNHLWIDRAKQFIRQLS